MNTVQQGSIVVGADGSPGAHRAVQWATEQAALEHRPLVVFTAARQTPAMVGTWPGPAYVYPADELLASAQAIADEAASLARSHRPDVDVRTAVACADARKALTDQSSDAYLLVLGSRGHGPVGSKMLGSVGANVIRHARCPVVVCRPGTDLRVKQGVLVGADGTAESLPVIDFAFRQASTRRQPLTVLHAFADALVGVQSPSLVASAEQDTSAHRLLAAESIAGFRERYPDVHVSLQTSRGFAADTMTSVADRYDLVVVGRHPVDTVLRHLLGPIATEVLEMSHTNVAVVPQAAGGSAH
jgi:nucleotide-binding universal stress UspA family protein